MSYSLFFLYLFFVILGFSLQGCSITQKKKYTRIPDDVHRQAEIVCRKIDGSQFIVRKRRVWLKKKDENEIELKHYKSILPDGYYFCSGNEGNSLIID